VSKGKILFVKTNKNIVKLCVGFKLHTNALRGFYSCCCSFLEDWK